MPISVVPVGQWSGVPLHFPDSRSVRPLKDSATANLTIRRSVARLALGTAAVERAPAPAVKRASARVLRPAAERVLVLVLVLARLGPLVRPERPGRLPAA
ncbi:hypothetical protein [Lamprocystis purpurea]|jgi:hypothetical protein|uniref:hypothetical protein n=1 Tax=Lamprocystis purpurea TaxID=61598 RepID=UPI0012FC3754|nr:hypothetical protein [Lamprocystis purpurea]